MMAHIPRVSTPSPPTFDSAFYDQVQIRKLADNGRAVLVSEREWVIDHIFV
jgi:hypothetical protein